MFKKEAKKWVKEHYGEFLKEPSAIFKAGAEYGYNKAKEEFEKEQSTDEISDKLKRFLALWAI